MEKNKKMQLSKFPEVTVTYAQDQAEYKSLPAHRDVNDPSGRITCCWQLSFWERIKLLCSGKIWHQILTFNKPLQPQKLTIEKPFFELQPSSPWPRK
jgi:hypothetical protein